MTSCPECAKYSFRTARAAFFPNGYQKWADDQLKRIRFHTIEFVANYRNKRTGSDITPATLKTYTLGIQSAFFSAWGYRVSFLTGPIFNFLREGLFSVIENKARYYRALFSNEAPRVVVRNYNAQGCIQWAIMYFRRMISVYYTDLLSCLLKHPKDFWRIIFTIGILTAIRSTSMATLNVGQFQKISLDAKLVWVITAAMGSDVDGSKTMKGGLAAIGDKPQEVCVWNEEYWKSTFSRHWELQEHSNEHESGNG